MYSVYIDASTDSERCVSVGAYLVFKWNCLVDRGYKVYDVGKPHLAETYNMIDTIDRLKLKGKEKCTIHTDSKKAIHTINELKKNPDMVIKELSLDYEKISNIVEHLDKGLIFVKHVPGHSPIMNPTSYVDTLARLHLKQEISKRC